MLRRYLLSFAVWLWHLRRALQRYSLNSLAFTGIILAEGHTARFSDFRDLRVWSSGCAKVPSTIGKSLHHTCYFKNVIQILLIILNVEIGQNHSMVQPVGWIRETGVRLCDDRRGVVFDSLSSILTVSAQVTAWPAGAAILILWVNSETKLDGRERTFLVQFASIAQASIYVRREMCGVSFYRFA